MTLRLTRFVFALSLTLLAGAGLPAITPAAAAQTHPYSFSWSGTPASPQAWNPATGFDVTIHDRDFTQTYDQPYSFTAQHGTDCSPFQGFGVGGTHQVTQYRDEVFLCANHLMTGVNGQGYGEVALTPGALIDWSTGPVTVTWQVDTLRTSCRDWLSFNVIPFADDLMLTDGIGVDLYGEPRNELQFTSAASCPTSYAGRDIRNFAASDIPGPGGSVSDVVSETDPTAAKNRQTFELDIASNYVRFGMPAFNKWFVDGALKSPLPYSQAVLQLEQHSYTPDKQCNPTPTFCAANTWHWSNIAISNAVPFTILRADRFQVAGGHVGDGIPDTVHFPAAAPANSYLRFEAISSKGSVRFSTDGGQTWITPTHQQPGDRNPSGDLTDAQAALYFWPIPAGATQVKFDARDAYWTWNAIRNISIWSTAPGSGVTVQPPGSNPPPINPPPTNPPPANPPPPVGGNPPPPSEGGAPGGESDQAPSGESEGAPSGETDSTSQVSGRPGMGLLETPIQFTEREAASVRSAVTRPGGWVTPALVLLVLIVVAAAALTAALRSGHLHIGRRSSR